MKQWKTIIKDLSREFGHSVMQRLPPLRLIPHGNWLFDLRRFGGRSLGPILDVGANIGQTTAMLARYFPRDPIFSFEPCREAFTDLSKHYGSRAKCFRLALGAQPGSVAMNTFDMSVLNTFREPGRLARSMAANVETVMVDTLDNVLTSESVDHVGLLKLDVQGSELEVLRGGEATIKAGRIRFIYAEVGFDPVDKDMLQFSEINSYLLNSEYAFCGMYDQFRYGKNAKNVFFANVLYHHRSFDT